jgi:short-subunit dehydrogenase
MDRLQLSICIALGTIACLCGIEVQALSLGVKMQGTTIVAGATGYIGKSAVRESVRQGYPTVALVRNMNKVQSTEGKRLYGEFFEGAQVIECDVSDPDQVSQVRK